MFQLESLHVAGGEICHFDASYGVAAVLIVVSGRVQPPNAKRVLPEEQNNNHCHETIFTVVDDSRFLDKRIQTMRSVTVPCKPLLVGILLYSRDWKRHPLYAVPGDVGRTLYSTNVHSCAK